MGLMIWAAAVIWNTSAAAIDTEPNVLIWQNDDFLIWQDWDQLIWQ